MQVMSIQKRVFTRYYKALHQGLILCIFLCLSNTILRSQCTTSLAESIPDDGTITIQFIVTGLVDSDLASPTQGICGINLDFMHEYLGDLTMTLISPSGTSVKLVGPVTTAFPPTNLSRFNVRFVPCATPAMPDAGFTPTWSNLQFWQQFTPYSGTYHPESGCLEDFNAGSANGVWQLVITDHDVLQIGTLSNALLLFCNPTGLQCAQCNPNGGTLSPSDITLCVGQNISSSDIAVDFGVNPPLPSSYSYQYLMTVGNSIISSGTSFTETPPPGNYNICGLSYLTVDSMQVNALLAAGDFNQLNLAISTNTICANLSTTCVSLQVLTIPDTLNISVNLCNGESYSFGGQDYTLMGTYYQTHDGPGLCDSVFQIQIFTSDLDFSFGMADSLSCSIGQVTINSFVIGNAGPVIYEWTTQTGNIVGASNASSVIVDQPGQFYLSVSDPICSKVKVITILADQGFPQVFVEGGQIDCNHPVLTLNPIYVPTNANLLWTGPMGFTSNQAVINVTIPGNYLLKVTNQSGCSTTKPVTVTIDTATVAFQIVSLGKDCQNGFMVVGSSYENVVGWDWTGPNNYFSNFWRPNISTPGLYLLSLTFSNGCHRTATYFFDGDFSIPDIMISADDTLHCNEVIPLSVSSTTPGVNYSWSGPSGFSSPLQNIQVNEPGNYSAVVNAPNGCSTQSNLNIALGADIFNYQTFTDTLTCAKDTITIGVTSADADLFKWIGFSGPDSSQSSIRINLPGTYTVMMTDTNTGCQIITNVQVTSDFTYPSFGYTSETITCSHPVSTLTFVPFQGFSYANVFWILPDQSVVPGPVLMSSQPGEHLLYGIGTNGCTGIWHIQIPFDTISPSLFIDPESLNCNDTAHIYTFSPDSIIGYQWSGPGIVSPGTDQIMVDKPGIYHLIATGLNGCSSEHDILVDSNYTTPVYSLTLDSLKCNQPTALEANSPDTLATYIWKNESGNIISNDSIALVNSPGFYTIEIRGGNNCTVSDTVMIDSLDYPAVTLVTDTITCIDTSVPVTASSAANPITYQWTDINGNPLGNSNQIIVADVGPYILTATSSNTCATIDTILVPIDTVPPISVVKIHGEVRCQNRDFMLDGSGSTPPGLDFSWSTDVGNLLSDITSQVVNARDTGLYILQVVRHDNGCSDLDSIFISENPEAIKQAILNVKPAACSGDSNAAIEITGLQGGVDPILYQLDGGILQSSNQFDGLKPGDYQLTIIDSAGCIYDTLVTVAATNPFTVNAGPDQEIYFGESVTLNGTTDLPLDQIINQQWDSLGYIFCMDCTNFNVSPHTTSSYRFQVISSTGCVLEDEVIIYVIEKGKYFIANVFSPNGDNINDEVRLYTSPGIVKVLKWIIFDRWGNAVFGKTNFDPADPSVVWNGYTPDGVKLNPAVFPYILEVELLNGKTEIYNGSITLLR